MMIDTSVAVKWFYEEAEAPHALRLLENITSHNVRAVVPDLLFYDAAYVALAFEWNVPLITADERLA